MLCIHGGGLAKGQRGACDALGMRLAARGYVAATIDYRLVLAHRHPSAIHDAKAAVRWLRAHAADHGIDPDRIGATCESAGGYLALMLGVTAGVPRFEGAGGNPERSSAVSCVVNVFGPSDLVAGHGFTGDDRQRADAALMAYFDAHLRPKDSPGQASR